MRWLLNEWKGPLGIAAFQIAALLLVYLALWGAPMTTRDTLERLALQFEQEAHAFAQRALREDGMSYRRGTSDGKAIAFGDVAFRLRQVAKEAKE